MELKNIANLIAQKKFSDAKNDLIQFVEKNKAFIKKKSLKENNYQNIYYTLAQVCKQLNELENSKKYLQKHLQINSLDCEALLNLTNLQLKTLDIKDIEKNYKKILKINKDYLPAIVNLAIFYEGVGKINSAKKYYEKAKKLEPNNLNFHYNLIRIDPKYLNDQKITSIKEVIKNSNVPKEKEFLVDFILSKQHEINKDYVNEIKFLDLSHQNFLKFNVNKKAQEYWSKIIPYIHKKLIFLNSTKQILSNMKPIFIIGLPRSGSTLTELILSTSKTTKHILGESNIINHSLINNYNDKLFNNIEKKIEIDLNYLEEKILMSLNNFKISSFDNTMIIDKSLENFFYVDLIIKIFPKAKFIITERNLKDNIIGIYKKLLLEIPWAHSIHDIVKYIDNYKNITNFYKKKYDKNFISIKLEDLKNSTKVKNLFKFCDLKFNQNYSDFKNNRQFVNNASNIQIRNNLEKYDRQKYKKYFHLLDQFKDKFSWID